MNTKKPLSILLTLALVLGILPWSVMPARAVKHGISYIDANGNAQTADNVDVVVESMNTNNAFTSDSGWLYVEDDVSLNGASNNGSVAMNLILGDGKTLTLSASLQFSNASLTIYGQSDGTGKLTISGSTVNNPMLALGSNNTLTINGGTVEATNNAPNYGAYAFGYKSLVMNGGSARFTASMGTAVDGNVTLNGGTFYANGRQGAVTGTVTIKDGLIYKDDSNNYYVGTLTSEQKTAINGKTLTHAPDAHNVTVTDGITNGTVTVDKAGAKNGDTVTLTATPDSGFALGTVTVTGTSGTVSTSGTGNTRTFTMPDENVTVTATFVHAHGNWTYEASGATVTATCGPNCTLTGGKVELTIAAPQHETYDDGKTAEATLTGLDAFNAATGLSIAESSIKYVGRDGTTYAESATAPTNAGKYTAKITAGGKTASVDYTVAKAPATNVPTTSMNLTAVYGQTLADVSLPSGWAWVNPTGSVGNAGGKSFDAIYTQDENHEWKIGLPVKVLAATVTVKAKSYSIYVGGTVPTLGGADSYTVTGLVGNDTLGGTVEMKYQQNGADVTPDASKAGTYDIVISGLTAPGHSSQTGGGSSGGPVLHVSNYNDVVFTAGKLTISAKPVTPSSGGGSSSSSSDDSPSTPSTTTTTADNSTVTNPDGSTTESTSKTTETKNADGSVMAKTTETATTTGADGSKTESKSEASTTTKENADGGTTATTKATEKSTMTDANGAKTVTETKTETTETLDRNGNGTVEGTTTETVTDASGKVLETTVTESKGTVATDENGTKTTTTTNTATTTDAEGNVTTTVTVEEKAEAKDGTVSTVVKDENGSVLSAEANVSEQAVEAAQSAGTPVQVPLEIAPATAANAETAAAVAITMPTASTTGGVAKMPRVEITVPRSGPGIIAMIRNALGKLIPVKECREGSVILPVSGSCEIVIVDNTKQFSDVKANDWFYDNVTFVTAREIFNGTGDGLFTPNASMTRGMLAQALYNFDRSAAPNDSYAFADARGKWYAGAASWAASVGVVTGTDEGFEGEANVTREAVATMLYRYAKAQGYDVAARADLSAFADAASVSDWVLEAMQWAVGTGLVNGMDGFLAPQAPATRAQLAAIIERFVENVVN